MDHQGDNLIVAFTHIWSLLHTDSINGKYTTYDLENVVLTLYTCTSGILHRSLDCICLTFDVIVL